MLLKFAQASAVQGKIILKKSAVFNVVTEKCEDDSNTVRAPCGEFKLVAARTSHTPAHDSTAAAAPFRA